MTVSRRRLIVIGLASARGREGTLAITIFTTSFTHQGMTQRSLAWSQPSAA
jgi:hypothetical protein